jgi:hypothetical protein
MPTVKFRHESHKGDKLSVGGRKVQFDPTGVAEVDAAFFAEHFAQNPDVSKVEATAPSPSTPVRRSATKKAAARKSSAKKAPAKKAAAKKAAKK